MGLGTNPNIEAEAKRLERGKKALAQLITKPLANQLRFIQYRILPHINKLNDSQPAEVNEWQSIPSSLSSEPSEDDHAFFAFSYHRSQYDLIEAIMPLLTTLSAHFKAEKSMHDQIVSVINVLRSDCMFDEKYQSLSRILDTCSSHIESANSDMDATDQAEPAAKVAKAGACISATQSGMWRQKSLPEEATSTATQSSTQSL